MNVGFGQFITKIEIGFKRKPNKFTIKKVKKVSQLS